jgi:hypothetical protein
VYASLVAGAYGAAAGSVGAVAAGLTSKHSGVKREELVSAVRRAAIESGVAIAAGYAMLVFTTLWTPFAVSLVGVIVTTDAATPALIRIGGASGLGPLPWLLWVLVWMPFAIVSAFAVGALLTIVLVLGFPAEFGQPILASSLLPSLAVGSIAGLVVATLTLQTTIDEHLTAHPDRLTVRLSNLTARLCGEAGAVFSFGTFVGITLAELGLEPVGIFVATILTVGWGHSRGRRIALVS